MVFHSTETPRTTMGKPQAQEASDVTAILGTIGIVTRRKKYLTPFPSRSFNCLAASLSFDTLFFPLHHCPPEATIGLRIERDGFGGREIPVRIFPILFSFPI
jgi:hypothetical protein